MSRRRPEDRPRPRRLAALSPRGRLIVAVAGILVGFGLIVGGLKLLDTDVNRPGPEPTPQTSVAGN